MFWVYIYFFTFIASLFYNNKSLLLKIKVVYSYIVVITTFATTIFSDFKLNDVLQIGISVVCFSIGQMIITKILFNYEKNFNKSIVLLIMNIVTFVVGIIVQKIF